jgi:hypothetical protein
VKKSIPQKIKNTVKSGVSSTMDKIMNNNQATNSSDPEPKQSSQNELLTTKIRELEKLNADKQFKLDSTVAELEQANKKIDRLMKSFGKCNVIFLIYYHNN